jgi:hypothetical protein
VVAPDFDKCLFVAGTLISDAITVADLNGCETDFSPPIAAVRQVIHCLLTCTVSLHWSHRTLSTHLHCEEQMPPYFSTSLRHAFMDEN